MSLCTTLVKWSEVAQSCPTLCDPMDCSLPASSIHGILQARTLEWVAIFFSRGSSRPRDQTQVSHIAGRHFSLWATREALCTTLALLIDFLQSVVQYSVSTLPLQSFILFKGPHRPELSFTLPLDNQQIFSLMHQSFITFK